MSRPEFTNAKRLCDYAPSQEYSDTHNRIHSELGDGLMIESLEIQNFRGFEHITLPKLKHINIIVGENGSGKTALLESLYLAAGGPALALKLRAWRGLGDRVLFPIADTASLSSLWRDIFYRFDQSKTALISLHGSPDMTRRLEIRHEPTDTVLFPANGQVKDVQLTPPILFEWFEGGKSIKVVRPSFDNNQLKIEGAPRVISASFYSSATPLDPGEIANWFSALDKKNNAGSVVDSITKIFPFIKHLSLQIESGISMIHADMDGLEEKIPIGLISSGINKLLALLVTIANQRVIYIDEIENGFYYKVMPKVWAVLYEHCSNYGTQIFASTHSWECLKAAANVVEKNEKDFCLLRAKRENGKCNFEQFDGKNFRQALDQQIDPR